MNDTLQAEQLEHFAEERDVIDVEAEAAVSKHAIDEEEITGTRAKIENALGRHPIEADVLNPADVHFQETLGLDVFGPLSGAGNAMGLLQLFQLRLINVRHKAADRQRAYGTTEGAPGAHDCRWVGELSNFMREFHESNGDTRRRVRKR